MKNIAVITFLFLTITPTFSQSEEQKIKGFNNYTDAWMMADSEERLKHIKTFWLEESIYIDPAASITGTKALYDMIEGFRTQFPDAKFYAEPLLSYGDALMWNWQLYDKDYNLIVDGRDYAELNSDGKLIKLKGFWETEESKKFLNPLGKLEQENKDVVAKYYECLFKTSDFETMATLIADDAVYNQAEGLPYGGTYIGFNEWIQMFIKAGTYFDLLIEKEPTYFTNDTKDEVIIRFAIKCTSKKSGKEISMPISEHFKVKDGKIVSIRPFYYDTRAFSIFISE